MGSTSLQACMDSSDWLQGGCNSMMHEESMGMDSSSSPSAGDMLACSRPLMERRLRPPHDQALKCPRCDSTHTKFCYYNNYSLSQPRYFCKTCRRYWTKGGTLRNIPVGGGCRKNKKVSSSKKSSSGGHDQLLHHSIDQNPTSSSPSSHMILPGDLHLSFPESQFSHLTNIFGSNVGLGLEQGLMEGSRYNGFGLLENPIRPIDFLERKIEAIIGNSRNHEFMGGNGELALVNGYEEYVSHQPLGMSNSTSNNFQTINICSPYGISLDGNNNGGHQVSFMDNSQKLMQLPYHEDGHHDHQDANSFMDVKPNPKLLSIDWQQDHHHQGCSSSSGKDSFGYLGNIGSSWTNVMNAYHQHHAPSTPNPLV